MVSPKSKKSSKSLAALGGLKEALGAATSVAEAAGAPFPVGIALESALKLVETAEGTVKNKKDCHELATTAAETMLSLADALKGKKQQDITDGLRKQMEQFQGKLSSIREGMDNMARRRCVMRVMAAKSDVETISSWKKELEDARWQFQQHGIINLQVGVTQVGRQVNDGLAQVKSHLDTHTVQLDFISSHVGGGAANNDNIFLSSTPPPKPMIFHGREAEVSAGVDTILGASCNSPSHLAILGSGGMGKTSLALAILHHEQVKEHFKKHIYFVPCESAASPEQLVSHITSVLKVQKVKDQDILTSLDSFLRAVPQLLLVLDNLETPYHNSGNTQRVVEILGRLGSIPQVTIIVTMRGDSTPRGTVWGEPLYARPLPPQASMKTFSDISQKEDPRISQLLGKIDHVPLAVTLVSNLAKSESVSNLLRQWERRKTAMLKDESGNARENNVEISIELSIRSKIVGAQEDALPLLAIISYLPDGFIAPYSEDPQLGKQKWEAMTGLMKDREDALMALSRTGLVQKTDEVFNTLSPIRQYVLKQYPPSEDHLKVLEAYYISLISGFYPKHHSYTYHHLSVEAGNIIKLVQDRSQNQSPVPPELLEAARKMSGFLYKHYRFDEAVQVLKEALQGYHKIGAKLGVANCLWSLGDTFRMIGRYEEAAQKLREALQGYEEMGDRLGVADCLRSLGNTFHMMARSEEAAQKLQEALQSYKEIGDRLGVANCLESLGDTFRMMDRYEEAAKKLQEALQGYEEIGSKLGVANCLKSLGDTFYMMDRYEEAAEKLQEALLGCMEVGDKLGVANCLLSLCNTLQMMDRYEESAQNLLKALQGYEEIGSKLGVANCLQSLGNTLLMIGRYEEAAQKLQEALQGYEEIGHRHGVVNCLRSLGDTFRMMGRYEEAAQKLQEALHGCEEIGAKLGVANCLQSLGNTLRMMDRYEEAAEKLQEALLGWMEIGDKLGVAGCLQSLGVVLKGTARLDEPREKLQLALEGYRSISNKRGEAACLAQLDHISTIKQGDVHTLS